MSRSSPLRLTAHASWLAALVALLVGVLVLKGLVGLIEPRLVFLPSRGEDASPADLKLRHEVVRITTSDGERLVAWQLEPDDPIADVVYFKGNGGNLSVWLPMLAALTERGFRVLAADYRGYGLSTGAPSEEGVYRDAEAVVRYVERARSPAPDLPLVYWGRSLGGPIAASATRAVPPDGLILESTFPDKASVIRTNPVLRVLNVFGSYRFSTVDLLQGFDRPILVMHGSRDSVIPFALGRELHERLDGRSRFVEIRGADHNDLFAPDDDEYWRAPLAFVAELRATKRAP